MRFEKVEISIDQLHYVGALGRIRIREGMSAVSKYNGKSTFFEIFGGSARYSKFVNSDFGFIRGVILAFNKRFSDGWSASLDYTFQIARGSNSDPEAARNALAGGSAPEVQLTPLDWDQTHTVNAAFSYGGRDWGTSLIAQWGSGLPYTPRATTE